jgi:hypothetical protein
MARFEDEGISVVSVVVEVDVIVSTAGVEMKTKGGSSTRYNTNGKARLRVSPI